MDEVNSFLELIGRVRAGDQSAAIELVRRYEPAIRRVVRLQMRDPGLRRILDSMDVCQSVLASFFLRAATGQYDLNQPAQLLRLLAVMARNKVASQARTSYVTRRDRPVLRGGRRLDGRDGAGAGAGSPGRLEGPAARGAEPSVRGRTAAGGSPGGAPRVGRYRGRTGGQPGSPAQAAGPRPGPRLPSTRLGRVASWMSDKVRIARRTRRRPNAAPAGKRWTTCSITKAAAGGAGSGRRWTPAWACGRSWERTTTPSSTSFVMKSCSGAPGRGTASGGVRAPLPEIRRPAPGPL